MQQVHTKTRQVCTVLADHLRYLYFIWYQFMYMCPVYVCVHVCSYASVWIKEIESMFSCADSTLCVMNEKVCSAVLTVHFVPWMKKYVQLWWQYTLCHEQNASNHHTGNSWNKLLPDSPPSFMTCCSGPTLNGSHVSKPFDKTKTKQQVTPLF